VTIAEAATYLFVSRPHIRKLLASGKIVEVLPRDPNGQVNIDLMSVEAYRRGQEVAVQAYQVSQAEGNEQRGH
jgi:hypothetical protein